HLSTLSLHDALPIYASVDQGRAKAPLRILAGRRGDARDGRSTGGAPRLRVTNAQSVCRSQQSGGRHQLGDFLGVELCWVERGRLQGFERLELGVGLRIRSDGVFVGRSGPENLLS